VKLVRMLGAIATRVLEVTLLRVSHAVLQLKVTVLLSSSVTLPQSYSAALNTEFATLVSVMYCSQIFVIEVTGYFYRKYIETYDLYKPELHFLF
jgi:hypothetical protein